MIIAIIILALFSITGIINTIILHKVTNKLHESRADYKELLDRHDRFVDKYGELITECEELESHNESLLNELDSMKKFFGRKVRR